MISYSVGFFHNLICDSFIISNHFIKKMLYLKFQLEMNLFYIVCYIQISRFLGITSIVFFLYIFKHKPNFSANVTGYCFDSIVQHRRSNSQKSFLLHKRVQFFAFLFKNKCV